MDSEGNFLASMEANNLFDFRVASLVVLSFVFLWGDCVLDLRRLLFRFVTLLERFAISRSKINYNIVGLGLSHGIKST